MQAAELVQAEYFIPAAPHPIVITHKIIAGGIEVAGIRAESDPMPYVIRHQIPEQCKLLEGAAQ
jgi:hypothetical protein